MSIRFDSRPLTLLAAFTMFLCCAPPLPAQPPKTLRAGIIGLDTSHATAFTDILNSDNPSPELAGCRIVAAYPKGSPDIESSVKRVPEYTEAVRKKGVEIVDSIDELLKRVDVVFLETNDGRPHLEQVRPVLKAGKPVFIDKPIAGSLEDAVAIFEEARRARVPVFSASSLRFGKNSLAVRGGSIGKVQNCETTSPANLEKSHPDLFWYGIHGVESLFTVMGTGCETVERTLSADGKIVVQGRWSGGRTGLFREGSGYSGTAKGENGEASVGSYDGYKPLVEAIVAFFRSGKPPVSEEETLEIYTFMEAADASKRANGAPVSMKEVLEKARSAVRARQ
jgi:predicted dehydrogenase